MSPSNTVEAAVPDLLLCVKRGGPRKPFCSPGKSHMFKRKVLSGRCNSVFTSVTYSVSFVQGLDSPCLLIIHGC